MRDTDRFINKVEDNRGKYKNIVKVHSQLKWIYGKAIEPVREMLTEHKQVGVTFVEKLVDELPKEKQAEYLRKVYEIHKPKKKDFEDVLNQMLMEE